MKSNENETGMDRMMMYNVILETAEELGMNTSGNQDELIANGMRFIYSAMSVEEARETLRVNL